MPDLAGTCYPVGPFGRVTTILPDLDFETYSEAGYVFDWRTNKWRLIDGVPKSCHSGLEAVGAVVYTEHPTAEILTCAYDLKDGRGPRVWRPGDPLPADLFDYIASGGLLESWNDGFEFRVWNNIAARRYGWPPLPAEQQRDAMAKARAFGLPGALEKAAAAIGAEIQKDADGSAIMKRLSKPRNPTKKDGRLRYTRAEDGELFDRLDAYCVTDIRAEAAVSRLVPDLDESEQAAALLDHRINNRGVCIDREALDNCAYIVRQAVNRYTDELRAVTGGAVETASQLQRLQGWLAGRGFAVGSLDEAAVAGYLAFDGIPPECRRALELRQMIGSASVKKLFAIERQIARDGRLHNLYVYHGAHTGRPAGRGPQPTNLPSGGPSVCQCETCRAWYWTGLETCPHCGTLAAFSQPGDWSADAVEYALEDIATRDLDYVEARWGRALHVVSGCLRGLFVATPGFELLCSDYSAIEAVVLAGLAGEDWRLDVFRRKERIYSVTAEHITGIPWDRAAGKHPKDKIGKFAELASGYGGWVNGWKAFGAGAHMTDAEIKAAVLKWRERSPAIVEMWGGQHRRIGYYSSVPELYGLEGAAVSAVMQSGRVFQYRDIAYGVKDDVLYCRLPSGRCLSYHKPRLTPSEDPLGRPVWSLSYMGWNSDSTKGPIGWLRRETYGGRLTENVVQAVARDIQTDAMKRIDPVYPVVLHVYDELVSEVPAGSGSVEHYEQLMGQAPQWAADWPIRASGGWRGRRYRKD